MTTARGKSAKSSTAALRRATLATPSRAARAEVNGHALDLASLFQLRRPPGYYNERAKAALLRRRRSGPQDELLVDFSGPEMMVELRGAGFKLVQGAWGWQVRIAAATPQPSQSVSSNENGHSLEATGSWSESCWHSDDDCDYLELELPLSGGWRLERQMLLARQDRFLLLADALLGPPADKVPPSEIRFESTLPLANGAAFLPGSATREGVLAAGRNRQALVLPLALSEWRSEFCPAEMSMVGGSLRLQQAALGRNLYAPLWLDLDPGRNRRPATWRRLTVAENLKMVSRDTAVGYRVRVGREQWLVYRSLGGWGNRSVLGQNYSTEFVCGRFAASGAAREILAIEPC
jgi:hypothetical protein